MFCVCTEVRCGVPFTNAEVDMSEQAVTSSNADGADPTDIALFSNSAWCAHAQDMQPFIKV